MIYIGSDHAGYELRHVIMDYLKVQGYAVQDCGNLHYDASDDFTVPVPAVVNGVLQDQTQHRGILICGSGLGVCIAANHYVGVRAAVFYDATYAQLARQHNDVNIMCLGARFQDAATAKQMVDIFLNTPADPHPKYKRRMQIADGSGC